MEFNELVVEGVVDLDIDVFVEVADVLFEVLGSELDGALDQLVVVGQSGALVRVGIVGSG